MTDSPPKNEPGRPRRRTMRRLLWFVAAGCVVIGAALFYVNFWFSRPVGMGPAGPPVPSAPFADVWSERDVLLLGFGDSVTAGFMASSRHSYFDRLLHNPPEEFPEMEGRCLSRVLPNLRSQNVALSGSTSLEHLDVLLPKIETQGPETFGLVVATIGGNDIIHNYGRTPPREGAMYGATRVQAQPWIEGFRSRLGLIIDRLDAAFPGGCLIFLANIYDPTDGVGDAVHAGLPRWPDGLQVLHAYNDILAECAETRDNVILVNMHDAFLGHGIHCRKFWHRHYDKSDAHYWYSENLEDPNDRGYDVIRRLFLREMVRVVPDSLKSPAAERASEWQATKKS